MNFILVGYFFLDSAYTLCFVDEQGNKYNQSILEEPKELIKAGLDKLSKFEWENTNGLAFVPFESY